MEKEKIDNILILTPVKNAITFLPRYFELLGNLSYPSQHLSLGFLESDSSDGTFQYLNAVLNELKSDMRYISLWKRDYNFHIPLGTHRSAHHIQLTRRVILAKSRNQLLFRSLKDEDWVLWMDADLVDYPSDIIEQLLATKRNIVQPHCVLNYGGRTFDRNAWRDHGKYHLDMLRSEGDLVPLDTVGGCMLLVRADLHRDGLVFPPFPYGKENPKIRKDEWGGELETEGLGIMALDMGYQPWGMPNLEILHRRG